MKGRSKPPLTDETKRKISEAKKGKRHPSPWLKGKHRLTPWLNDVPRTEETKRKISEALKDKPKSKEMREKLSKALTGKHPSEETKLKLGMAHKGQKFPSEKYPNYGMRGKHLSEEAKKKITTSNNQQKRSVETKLKISKARLNQIIPFHDTKPEKILQSILNNKKIYYEKHIALFGQPDIFIPPNILIFADGCYWHGCKKCFPKNYNIHGKPIEVRIQKDEEITNYLIAKGFQVLRFWEHEIYDNQELIWLKINNVIKIVSKQTIFVVNK